MAIKLYGIPGSRALRSIWAIEEVGAKYELVPVTFGPDSKKPEYLAVNPNGRIPALVDGDLTLFESMAINLYLAKTYGKDLYPSKPADESRAIQWSVWGMTEIEPHLMAILLNRMMLPEGQRDEKAAAKAEQDIERPLKVLDAHLANRKHLLGGEFTIADLNVASVLSMAGMIRYDVSKFANVKRWLDACLGRPSFARARKAGS
jgi:glutathione S-transferase